MRGRAGNWKRNSCAAVCHLRPSLAMYHEMERRLGRFVNVRTNYQHTTSGGGILLTEQQHEGRNVHALGAGGRSTYRQFEATARLSWERGQQLLFSYVRSKALGDLNTCTAYLGDFPTAPLRPNHSFLITTRPDFGTTSVWMNVCRKTSSY